MEQCALVGVDRQAAVWRRDDIEIDVALEGPLLVIDTVATTYVAPGWTLVRHISGCLLLHRVGCKVPA
jgi:N-methylhydantoinase A